MESNGIGESLPENADSDDKDHEIETHKPKQCQSFT